jgi:predicted acylesterase/phospholipase RssA
LTPTTEPEDAAGLRTVFFDTCRAVFQGGGCRAAALAGAYEAASAAGVHFSEVAGTSAGSILAALIGAGAEPAFVRREIERFDFLSLLRPPEPQDGFRGLSVRLGAGLAALLPSRRLHRLANVLRYGGVYSSGALETWIDSLLGTLLPTAERPVQFGDLLLPTYVVATDLAAGGPRVWSTEETPKASVAVAVRASCSIPLFFQPVVEGNSRLVDGGVLSNLPSFVFSRRGRPDFHPHGRRILAFRLEEDWAPPGRWSPYEILVRLLDAVINGATELQVDLHQEVHSVFIPTGTLRATDFDKMSAANIKTLVDSGANAARDFIRHEATHLQRLSEEARPFRDADQVFFELVQQAESPAAEILIAASDTRWFWQLFPTVLHWRRQGSRVRALLTPVSGDGRQRARELTRRQNLVGLGVEVVDVQELPFAGYLFRREDFSRAAAVVYLPEGSANSPVAVRYEGRLHYPVIQTLEDRLTQCTRQMPAGTGAAHLPDLVPYDAERLCDMLKKGVGQYSKPGVTLTVEEVEVERVLSLTRLIRAYKYRQVIRLAELFRERRIPLFGPAAATLADGTGSILAPPVVEVSGDRYVGIEGNTRTYYCSRNGIRTLTAVVVRGVQDPPPGRGVELARVSLVNGDLEPEDRMPGFEYSNFRRIEGAVHPLLPVP